LCADAIGLLLTAPAFAQISTAQLDGRVTDTSGGVLPGVTVTMTQAETGAVRSVVTDENGGYLTACAPARRQLSAPVGRPSSCTRTQDFPRA